MSSYPIRICYVIDNISFRGGERNFAQLALGLDRKQYDIHVICSPGGQFVEQMSAAGIPVFPANIRQKWNLALIFPMARYLRQHQIDIVHTQGRGDPFGRLAARLAGTPITVSTVQMIATRYHAVGEGRKLLYSVIDRVTDPMVDHWIVVNQESIDTLVQQHHISPERITLVLNGVELDRYAPSPTARTAWRARWQLQNGDWAVGTIGRLTWQKGFEYLLKAWPQVQAQLPQARLFILGDGELEQELKAQASQLGIEQSCTFTGFETDVPSALAGLDMFVLPSVAEGLPMVLLEAMAADKPVIATTIEGSRLVVTNEVDGLLVDPGDVDGLAAALLRLLQSSELRTRLGHAARQTIEQRFTVERVVRETEAVYRRLWDTLPDNNKDFK